ncbi:sigma-70 family RNA polymerase sigma factor [Mycobacterium pyrenivorans]|nr:sigma-70 family RNA polymerase sigma factor [Mycolicibacterium pyrenivorans]
MRSITGQGVSVQSSSAPDECEELRACFEREVVPLRAELLRAASRLTNRGAYAEDLVQDALLRAYRSYGTFSPGTNARAWMHQILKNTWINNYRAAQRRVTEVPMDAVAEQCGGGADPAPTGSRSAELTLIAAQPDTEVQAAMATLNDEFRMVVYLADVEGHSYAEIAEVMDTPVGTVMSRLHRARRQLRVLLGDAARRRRLIEAPERLRPVDSLPAAG